MSRDRQSNSADYEAENQTDQHGPTVNEMINDALEKLTRGDLYMEYGLEENDIYKLVSDSSMNGVGEKFKKLLDVILDAYFENRDMGSRKHMKKERKRTQKWLQSEVETIITEIRSFIEQRQGNQINKDDQHSQELQALEEGRDTVTYQNNMIENLPEENEPSEQRATNDDEEHKLQTLESSQNEKHHDKKTSTTRKKGKKGKKGKAKKTVQHDPVEEVQNCEHTNDEIGLNEQEIILSDLQLQYKEQFEKEKEKILSQIPDEVRNSFRTQCFVKWYKLGYLPAIQISPFDVEPGPVREQWKSTFEKALENDRPMSRLIYWYGCEWEKRGEAYSFFPPSALKTLEQGQREGLNKVPQHIKKKVDSEKKLTTNDKFILRAFEQFKSDKKLPPEDRISWMTNFFEDYMYADEIPVNYVENPPYELPNHNSSEVPIEEKKVSKKKKYKRKKAVEVKENQDDFHQGDAEAPKKKKKPKKKKEHVEVDDTLVETNNEGEQDISGGQAKVSVEKHEEKENDTVISAEKDVGGEENVVIKSAETDAEHNENEEEIDAIKSTEIDAESYENGDVEAKVSKKRKESSKDSSTGPKRKKKKSETDAQTSEPTEDNQPSGEPSQETMISEVNEEYSESEKKVLGLMSTLRDETDNKVVSKALEKIKKKSRNISNFFMENSGLVSQIKKTKKAFKEKDKDVFNLSLEVMNHLKEVYENSMKSSDTGASPPSGTTVNKEEVSMLTPVSSSMDHVLAATSQESPSNGTNDAYKDVDEPLSNDENVSQKLKSKEMATDIMENNEKPTPKPPKVKSDDQIKTEGFVDNDQESLPDPPKFKSEEKTAEVPNKITSKLINDTSQIPQIPKKNGAHTSTEDSPQCQPTVAVNKIVRKTFSLKGMLGGPKPATGSNGLKDTVIKSSKIAVRPSMPQKEIPRWLTNATLEADSLSSNQDRSFALEFFDDAFSSVPEAKVNRTFASRALEAAVYKCSKENTDMYWEKVHDVVAAIRGKGEEPGTIVKLMIDGFFPTAFDIVKLPRKKLHASFEGNSLD